MASVNYTSTATTEAIRIYYQPRGITMTCHEKESNWAFIDMQNLHMGVKEKGWKIHWKRFRQYLEKEHNVTKAIVFIGYLKQNAGLYGSLIRSGFTIEFRPVKQLEDGTIDGGNVDADLASCVMDHKNDYDKAIIVADDGDYCRTIKSLDRQNKLKLIISSHSIEETSDLIKREIARRLLLSVHSIKDIVEFTN